MIHLVLHGEVRQYSAGLRTIDVPHAPTVAEVLIAAGIPVEASAALIVNGEQRDRGAALEDGDTVEVLPAISGGVR